jgi:DNA (cytosine-5)-methyltransferase 1
MAEGNLPIAPIWDDVTTLKGSMFDKRIGIIYGGFPCQDISVAGLGKGLDGERSGLVFEIFRLTRELKPTFVFLENVPAIRTRGLDRVLQEFTKIGYDCRWTMLSASEVGAQHLRERWFFMAHLNNQGLSEFKSSGAKQQSWLGSDRLSMPYKWRKCDPSKAYIRRGLHGIPNRVDRIKCLGNAVVPLQAKKAFEILIGLKSKGE